jgi:hypothetical protein
MEGLELDAKLPDIAASLAQKLIAALKILRVEGDTGAIADLGEVAVSMAWSRPVPFKVTLSIGVIEEEE